MNEEKFIFRTRRERDFTTVPNELVRNKTLSFKARGLMLLVLSNVDEWQVHQGWLCEQATEGREAIRSAMQELEAAGYAMHEELRQLGRIYASRWTFFDVPQPISERTNKSRWREELSPNDGNPSYGKPSDGNPSTKKDYKKEDHRKKEALPLPSIIDESLRERKEEFVKEWNSLPDSFPKIRALTSDRERHFTTRFKEAEFRADWREALNRVKVSKFCAGANERGWKASVDWFLKPGTVCRILEGKYDNKAAAAPVDRFKRDL